MKKQKQLMFSPYYSYPRQLLGLLSFAFLMLSSQMYAQTYTYSYMPAMGSYTSTGSGTSSQPAINYNNGSLAGGTTSYTNGEIKATVYSHTSSTITFRVAKTSGYFRNGNSGKVFILDNYYGDVYPTSFSISNSTTSYLTAKVTGYSDFTGTRTFSVFLITSDQVYKQYGGKISITGTKTQLPPTVQTYEPTNITSNSAKFSGRVNPNGSSTTYYFKYGTSSSMNQKTSSKTLSSSSGETSVSMTVSDLSSNSHYYVQLWAENSGGTSKGDLYTFDTQPAPNNPPSVPSNPSPSVASTDQPVSGTLSWSCSDPDGDDITYKVYLGTSTSNMSLYKTVYSRSCSYSLEPATRYYWYVVASDGQQSSTGQTWNFKTKSNLSKPTNPSPADYSTDIETTGTFSWSGNNNSGVTYAVWLGTSSVDLKQYKTTTSTSVSYEGLEADQNYFWKVIVTDGNETESSALWTFKTKATPTGSCTFPDLPSTNDYYNATCYLYGLGVLSGVDANGNMQAEKNLTRAHLAKIGFRGVYSIKNRSVPSTVPSDNFPTVYSDLTDKSTYYYQAARALLYLEYGDGVTPFDRDRLKFAPEEYITRLHVLKVLMETFNIQPDVSGTGNPFASDADVVTLASKNPRMMGYIRRAASLGIITTANSKFRPYDNCLRGEAFVMLANIMQKVDAGTISDPNPKATDYFQPLNTTQQTIALGLGLQMGNFQHYTKTSFALSGTVPLSFAHTYNSYNTTLPEAFYGVKEVNGVMETYQPLGDGWSHNYHTFITVVGSGNDLRAVVHWGGGSIDIYKSNGSELVPESYGVYDKLYNEGSDYVVKTKDQIYYRFNHLSSSGAVVLYLTSITDRNGNTMTLSYETGENGSKRIKTVSDGNRSLSFSYRSGTNLVSSISDPLGRSIKFSYTYNTTSGHYQLSSFTDAKGQTTNYSYGDASNVGLSKLLTQVQLPKGNYIKNQYDANRRLTKTENGTTKTTVDVTPSYGSSSVSTSSQVKVTRNGSQTSTYNYQFNGNNRATSISGPKSLSVNSTYYTDASRCHLPKSISTNSTNISNITYDDNGNVKSVSVTGDGTLTSYYEYDSMNNLTSATDPKGYKTTYSYDSKGNLTGVSAPEGVSTSLTVNSKGLPTKVTNPMGVNTEFEYNSYGNLTRTTLPTLSLSSSASYDKASRLTSSTDALGRTTSFVYDDNDNLTSETDAASHTTSFAYDKNDNLTGITNAKGGVTSMSYDNVTDWLTSVSFAGATKRYSYNDDGSLSTFTKPDGTTLSYSYDDLGRVTNDGVNSYSYDSKLRLQSLSGNGKTMTFSYDGFNRITGTSCDGHSNSYSYDKNGNCTSINNTTYGYDQLNRLTSVKFNGKTISYTYRKDSQLEKVTYPNGMTTTFGYDAVGRLTSKITKVNGTVVASYEYQLDKAGNITKQTTKEPYEDIGLTNEDVSYSYNSGNRITKAGDTSFSFDENGNTTKRGGESYQWDESDRLTKAGTTSLTYDPLGLIASYGNITFTTDPLGIGNVLSDSKSGAEYIYGNGLEARVVNGKVSYYVTDVRGSVVAIVDESGKVTHKYQYDEFGKVTQKEEADYNPFQYVGKYGVMYLTDHQYYMRARHYDPTIGRFLSEDPIWSTNLYPYADNNPIMGIDPEGTLPQGTIDIFESRRSAERYYGVTESVANALFEQDVEWIEGTFYNETREELIQYATNRKEILMKENRLAQKAELDQKTKQLIAQHQSGAIPQKGKELTVKVNNNQLVVSKTQSKNSPPEDASKSIDWTIRGYIKSWNNGRKQSSNAYKTAKNNGLLRVL
jgi:RHS repeat-associated protein